MVINFGDRKSHNYMDYVPNYSEGITIIRSYIKYIIISMYSCYNTSSFPSIDLIRNINDPEHPLTLEQLNVVQQGHIDVSDLESKVTVSFTPTIPHCSMATLIGLSIRVRLLRSLPTRFKVLTVCLTYYCYKF